MREPGEIVRAGGDGEHVPVRPHEDRRGAVQPDGRPRFLYDAVLRVRRPSHD